MNYTYAYYQIGLIVVLHARSEGVNEFCRECPKCCRVFECDDDEQFQEENRRRSSTAPPTTNVHLKNVFWKWNIDKMFSSSEIAFLGKVIAQFQEITGKSVNYPRLLFSAQLF